MSVPIDRVETIRQLEARLEKGWDLLEAGRGSPAEIARWEAGWLQLLREYERAVAEGEAPHGSEA